MKSTRGLWTAAAILAVLSILSGLGVSRARATDEEEMAIKARAAEIESTLDDVYGARAASNEYWLRLKEASNAAQILKNAENVVKTEPPKATEELYKEYYRNGNRSNYQSVRFRLESRIIQLTLAEKIEGKGRFVDALNAELDRFCDLKSWVLPAHDRDAQIYDGKAMYSDLGSTLAGANVAIAVNLLEDKLDPQIVEKAKREVERRVLEPYERAVKKQYDGMWWVRTTNNWNAVCHAGTTIAALNIVESKARRAFFIAGAEYFSEHFFFKGFTEDGYCSEGMGYWNYGFGNYIYLGAAIRFATHGQVDMFRFPKVHAVLDFAPNLEIDQGNYAVFADCSANAGPNSHYVGYLSRLKDYGYKEFEARAFGKNFHPNDLVETTTIGYDEPVVFREETDEPQKYAPPVRTEFKDAGVVICRPGKDAKGRFFAIALKGGSNNEMHNHNDVGSYSLLLGDKSDATAQDRYISRDPGGETYTARTFSSRRYEGELLNSYGHPVPKIAGKLQSPGAQCRGIVVSKSFEDAEDDITFDITSAYPEATTLAKALRTFQFRRAHGDDPGFVTISDAVSFKENEKGSVESAIITFEEEIEIAETNDGGLTLKLAGAVVRVSAKDAAGAPRKLVAEKTTVGENDESVKTKPTRVALRIAEDVHEATIIQRFDVQ